MLAVVYLVFTEGYAATSGDDLVRRELCGEAIRLGRLLVELMPTASEAHGLLALMLLHDARRATRLSATRRARAARGAGSIARGIARRSTKVSCASSRRCARRASGRTRCKSAIAALHASAPTAAETDWRQIAALYAFLLSREPSPVVELNHAVAVAMVDGAERGIAAARRDRGARRAR